jgi:hypothetical protein
VPLDDAVETGGKTENSWFYGIVEVWWGATATAPRCIPRIESGAVVALIVCFSNE